MKMKLRISLMLLVLVFVSVTAFGQQFIPAFDTFSGKKVAYVTLEDGTKVEGTIKDLDRKKGQIESITLKDSLGNKTEYTADQIKVMYLPPSGFDKVMKTIDFAYDATQWGDDIEQDVINKGYAYFEKTEVEIKKKTFVLLMQLVNPTFPGEIRIYTDPFAKETASLGIAGVTVAGGEEKSYFVKKGEAPAYKMLKKDYNDSFKTLYKGCQKALKFGDKKVDWSDFASHVAAYNQCK